MITYEEMWRSVKVQLPHHYQEVKMTTSTLIIKLKIQTGSSDTLRANDQISHVRVVNLIFFTPYLSKALDKCKMSDRDTVKLLWLQQKLSL